MTLGIPPEQAEVAAFLRALSGGAPLETHISAVFRGADRVWKLKKAVRLGFLDFTAVTERKRFLDRELALNAPYAPGLYRDVVPITRIAQVQGQVQGVVNRMALGGDGEPVDYVLRMARVPASDFLDAMAEAGGLPPVLLLQLADAVAAMHAAQPPVPGTDPLARMQAVARGNADAARAAGLPPDLVAEWARGIAAALARTGPLLRARAPLVRRAHGDLHLGNLLLWHGRPVPFDALEFNEDLATIDPGYDLAFLLMDLDRLVSRPAANTVLNRYVARTGDAGLVGVLPPFLSLRAMVRAHVEATRGRPYAALLDIAFAALRPAPAMVLAIGGLMGSGKSTLARALAPTQGAAPGALVLRSDETRKRLFGVPPEQRLPAAAYAPDANTRTDAALVDAVRAAAGHTVIVDATFMDPLLRAAVAEAAAACGVAFAGFWLDVPLPELERRVATRTLDAARDASDATVTVLRDAHARVRPPADWTRIVAGDGDIDAGDGDIDAGDTNHARDQVQSRLAML